MKTSNTFTLGFSPCPNDTFIFDALIHDKINTQGIRFLPVIKDVEELNQLSLRSQLDISKVSFYTYFSIVKNYTLLKSGAAMGKGVGPLFISKDKINEKDYSTIKVAVPGKNTTANLLLTYFYPQITNKKYSLFSEIENLILSKKVDAGVIIHENRFTYQQKGLVKIADLGQLWEKNTQLPLPLGCIVMKNGFSKNKIKVVETLLGESIEYGFKNPDSSRKFILENAQDMDKRIIQKHIELYVNNYSLDIGKEGEKAINCLKKIIVG